MSKELLHDSNTSLFPTIFLFLPPFFFSTLTNGLLYSGSILNKAYQEDREAGLMEGPFIITINRLYLNTEVYCMGNISQLLEIMYLKQ
jgi:hypothetical protein